ncbi:MAG TPA: hypothetical protein VN493_13320 [Thermoanaerobaculia bacterium]|nr:hypothetical protein [Thermoanaerobaculia bacterium]
MRMSTFLTLLFILYCAEAGVLLIFAPWSPVWDRTMVQIPIQALRGLMLHPFMRGAVSGFGLVHLVLGAHDLHALLTRRKSRASV